MRMVAQGGLRYVAATAVEPIEGFAVVPVASRTAPASCGDPR
jgi:hypothetical protein